MSELFRKIMMCFCFLFLGSYLSAIGLSRCQESGSGEVAALSEQCSENQITIDAVRTCMENLDQCLSQQVPVDTESTRCFATPVSKPMTCNSDNPGRIEPGNGYFYWKIDKVSSSSYQNYRWNEAKDECINQGGNLAAVGIRNCTSARIIFQRLCLHVTARYWIGLNRLEGEWKWLDGVKADSVTSNWKNGIMPDGDKSCASMRPQYMLIEDEKCSSLRLPAICEQTLSQ